MYINSLFLQEIRERERERVDDFIALFTVNNLSIYKC